MVTTMSNTAKKRMPRNKPRPNPEAARFTPQQEADAIPSPTSIQLGHAPHPESNYHPLVQSRFETAEPQTER
jgi:hypothetical protein